MTAPRLLSSWPARRLGPQGAADALAGRAQRHQQNWSDLADADFDLPREPMTFSGTLCLIAIMLASATVMVGMMMWVIEELAR